MHQLAYLHLLEHLDTLGRFLLEGAQHGPSLGEIGRYRNALDEYGALPEGNGHEVGERRP